MVPLTMTNIKQWHKICKCTLMTTMYKQNGCQPIITNQAHKQIEQTWLTISNNEILYAMSKIF